MDNIKLPYGVIDICSKLKSFGFEAFVVGGSIRDLIMGRECSDFDIATDALPDDITSIFPNAKPYGNFGTMLVITDNLKIEITPFRNDAPGRKPKYVFGGNIYTDLSRRDFTINSIAFDPINKNFIDPFNGFDDIKGGIIRCTRSTKRIWEDPLRAMRAARFQSQLGFKIESSTFYALKAGADQLSLISWERIRDELIKLLLGKYCFEGLVTLVVTDLMQYIIPELMEGMGLKHSNKPVDVLEHNISACSIVKNTLPLRLAALLHDVAKPRTSVSGKNGLKFPDHHTESAFLAEKILQRLKFDKETIKKVVLLIQNHMFCYTPDTPISAARKLISKVGWENIYDLIEIRIADRLSSGFDQAYGPGLKKLISDLESLKKENSDYQIKDLAICGRDLIEELNISAGPKIGQILNKLLEFVIEAPELNTKKKLLEIAKKLI